MMKKIQSMKLLFIIALVIAAVAAMSGCAKANPEDTVKTELDAIKKLDKETMDKYITFTNLFGEEEDKADLSEDEKDISLALLKGFDYKVTGSNVTDDKATVKVDITSLDMKQLITGYYKEVMAISLSQTEEDAASDENLYALLKEQLNKEIPMATNEFTLNLEKIKNKWELTQDENLENALYGGLLEMLDDSHFFSAEDTVKMMCDGIKSMQPDVLAELMGMEESLGVDEATASELGKLFAEQMVKNLSYTIVSSNEEGENATVAIDITSFSFGNIMKNYMDQTMEFATKPEAAGMDAEGFELKSYEFLIDAVRNNTETITSNIELEMVNTDAGWEISDYDELINAICGDIIGGVTSMTEGTEQ